MHRINMIINRIIFFLIFYCSSIYGKCDFHIDDVQTKDFNDKINKWNINRNFTVSQNGLTYLIGLCESPNNTTAAIIQQDKNSSSILGRLGSVNLIEDDNWILLTYEKGDPFINRCDNVSRTASLMLVCGPNKDNLTILQEHTDEQSHCNYMFKLQIPQMCPTVEKSNKLSGGAIFLIILFSLATVYLLFGAIFMHIKRGARGIEHIPNLDMWRKLGNYAADGCDFCCRCERPISRAGYFLDESGPDIHGNDDDILSP